MLKVIDFCGELKNVGKKIFVLADMKELGAESKKSHETIGLRVKEVAPAQVYFVGPEMKAAMSVSDNNSAKWFADSSDSTFKTIAENINLFASDNDVILLKGSHSMQLEKLVPLLCGTDGEAC